MAATMAELALVGAVAHEHTLFAAVVEMALVTVSRCGLLIFITIHGL